MRLVREVFNREEWELLERFRSQRERYSHRTTVEAIQINDWATAAIRAFLRVGGSQ